MSENALLDIARDSKALKQLGPALFPLCSVSPEIFVTQVRGIDATTGEHFSFGQGRWDWQLETLGWWEENPKSISLKARQLGLTWLAGFYCLWHALFKPGSRCLIVSISESEAAKVVNRIWDMYIGCPQELRKHVSILKPQRGRPSTHIEMAHPSGLVSTIIGLPSTPSAGHGETAALVVLDEFARQEYAAETFKAILPTVSGGGRAVIVSTANGVGAIDHDAGSNFYYLYQNANDIGFAKQFYGWRMHPERDDAWYAREAMALPLNDRLEQYPDNEEEAFVLTGDLYFDGEAISWYAKSTSLELLKRGTYDTSGEFLESKDGWIKIYEEPAEDGNYAAGVDCATGRGRSFNSSVLIDLSTLAKVAEVHGKMGADQYANQLYWLGKRYNSALLAVEMAGGYGEPVVILLRNHTDGRPAYPHLYRHREHDRVDWPERKSWGFPMNSKMRALSLGYLDKLIRERAFPALDMDTIMELRSFVRKPSGTSPRAQDGCNDDRVMSLAIVAEMFRRYGSHEGKFKPTRRKVLRHRDFPAGSPEWEVPFDRRYG